MEKTLMDDNYKSTDGYVKKVISSYKNSNVNATIDDKKKMQTNKLNLQVTIQNSISNAYKKLNPKITHFYKIKIIVLIIIINHLT